MMLTRIIKTISSNQYNFFDIGSSKNNKRKILGRNRLTKTPHNKVKYRPTKHYSGRCAPLISTVMHAKIKGQW